MSNRPSRSASIPITRSSVSSSPAPNIESVISIPFSASPSQTRPRLGGQGWPSRSSIADDHRGVGISHGVRSSSTIATSPVRPTARSLTQSSGFPSRNSPRNYEPRVVRAADMSGTADSACVPWSTSPTRVRRMSTTAGPGVRGPSMQRSTSGHSGPLVPDGPIVVQRPAYLDYSAMRHLLHTEDTSTSSPTHVPTHRDSRLDPSSFSRSRISMDSDEDDMSPPPPRRDYSSMSTSSVQATNPTLRLPTGWCEQFRNAGLSVSRDGRELSYNVTSNTGTDKDSAAARTTYPIPPACGIFYYEVEITSKTTKGHISIGFNGKDVKTSRLPGWEKHSWGYHGDDGLAFAADRQGRPYGPQFGAGDVIGCGIDFSQNKAFYTKNGKLIGHVFENIGKDCELYPAVGLCHNGESIRANFGHEPFKYDIDDHVLQQRNHTWASIQSTPLRWPSPVADSKDSEGQDVTPSSLTPEDRVKVPINRLILAYLSHHGYARTARSFEATCSERGALSDSESLAPTSSAAVTEDQVMDMDDVSTTSARPISETGDIELRTQIVQSVFRGDVDTALSETHKYFPAVLERDQGLMLIKLRCRKFVEMILEAAELKKKMSAEESEMAVETAGDGAGYEGVVGGMDIDDDASMGASGADGSTNGFGVASSSSSAAIPIKKRKQSFASQHGGLAATQYGDALAKAVAYGQELQSDYSDRPEVRVILKRASVIVAYDDPLEAGGDAAEVAGQNARVALATELNEAILQSQGRPTRPALERLYRETGACLMQLALLGVGAAAFADMPKELLDA